MSEMTKATLIVIGIGILGVLFLVVPYLIGGMWPWRMPY